VIPTITVAAPPSATYPVTSVSTAPRSLGSSAASPVGSVPHTVKGKFQDLDKFLDSESETEEEEESDSDESHEPVVRAVTAPPRSVIVPEYDENTSEDEDEEESDEEAEGAPLYGQFR
jgi:AP-3 complex subunit beta